MTRDNERATDSVGFDGNSCEEDNAEGAYMGVPLLVTTDGSNADWPEVVEAGALASSCDCGFDTCRGPGASETLATMGGRPTGKEV